MKLSGSITPYTSPFISQTSPRCYHVFHLIKTPDAWQVIDTQANEVIYSSTHEFSARQKVSELAQGARPSKVVIYNTTGKVCGSSLYP